MLEPDKKPSEAEEAKGQFLSLNIERIEQCFLQAVEDGEDEPIVIALDARDDTSQAIMQSLPEEAPQPPAESDNPGVIFSMSIDEAHQKLGAVHAQAATFIDHAAKAWRLMGKNKRLALFMVISNGLIECKVHPMPE